MYKTGDIFFFTTGSPLAIAIRGIAGIKQNHVEVATVEMGQVYLIGARKEGVVKRSLEEAMKDIKPKYIKVCRPNTVIDQEQYIIRANKYAGKTPYDRMGLLVHQFFLNVFGRYIGKMKSKEDKSFYCYEHAAFMNQEHVPEWHKVVPKEFLDAQWHSTIFEERWTR